MKLGLMLSMPGDNGGPAELVSRAAAAEAAGFSSGWLPQVATVDALTVLALAGSATSRLELGTAVVPTYPRHPTVLAMQALTTQAATGNRLALGIGLSHRMLIEGSLGLDYARPIPHMREYLTVLNGLLAGERVQHAGDEYRVNAQVAVAGAKKPRVVVAALGPDMLRLCGRLADGTVTWMGGIPYLRDVAIPVMSAAAAKAGRGAPRFVAMVPVLLTPDIAAGKATIDAAFQVYGQIPSYRSTLDRGGATGPSDVAVVGNGEDLEAGIRAYADIGVTDFVAVVPPAAPEARATTEAVSAMVRRFA